MALTATPAVKQGLAQVRTRSHRMCCPALAAHADPGPDKLVRLQMLKGGVIMDVVNAEQARIAEEAGAVAVMALERVPADIRADGGVARMSDPRMIKEIMAAVTIPVRATGGSGALHPAAIPLPSILIDCRTQDESERQSRPRRVPSQRHHACWIAPPARNARRAELLCVAACCSDAMVAHAGDG
jgi:hypothetical protein